MKPSAPRRVRSITAFLGLALCGYSGANPEIAPGLGALDPPSAVAAERLPASAAARPASRPAVDMVLLLTVDAFRADQPWVGYQGIDTPHLSTLASKSIVYTRAYSLATITTASLSAMLAGRYPSELDREACIFGRYELKGGLAPYLQSTSVGTFAAHAHAIFAGRIAPSLGFERWRLVKGVTGRLQREGAVVGADLADLMVEYLVEERSGDRKLLGWAHFPDPHDAYVAHESFPPKSRSMRRSNYDSEVAYTDAAIGRVLQVLEQKGLQDRTAVIVTADHGEAFGEHGTQGHGFTMFEEEIRVPLLVYVPGVERRTIDAPRSTIDIAPTIAELLGHSPPPNWKGTSLLGDFSTANPESRPVVVDLPEMNGRSQKQAVIVGDIKAILTPTGNKVFDLARDPQELAPIANDAALRRTAIEAARKALGRLEPVSATPCGT